MQNPETKLINKYKEMLHPSIYVLKTMMPMHCGIPDLWLCGTEGRSVWAEVKQFDSIPVRKRIGKTLRPLQEAFLQQRAIQGQKCFLLASDGTYDYLISPEYFRDTNWQTHRRTKQEVMDSLNYMLIGNIYVPTRQDRRTIRANFENALSELVNPKEILHPRDETSEN